MVKELTCNDGPPTRFTNLYPKKKVDDHPCPQNVTTGRPNMGLVRPMTVTNVALNMVPLWVELTLIFIKNLTNVTLKLELLQVELTLIFRKNITNAILKLALLWMELTLIFRKNVASVTLKLGGSAFANEICHTVKDVEGQGDGRLKSEKMLGQTKMKYKKADDLYLSFQRNQLKVKKETVRKHRKIRTMTNK